jgi:hypothetical protein
MRHMSTTETTTDLAAQLAALINEALPVNADLPRFASRKVFICGLLDLAAQTLPVGRPALELALVEANRRHLLTLSRADHVAAMDPALVAASHIHHRGSDFHFVQDPGEHFYNAPFTPPQTRRVAYQPPAARRWALTHHHIDHTTGERTLLATAEVLGERDEHDLVVTVVTYHQGLERGDVETFRDFDFEDACERMDRNGFRPV